MSQGMCLDHVTGVEYFSGIFAPSLTRARSLHVRSSPSSFTAHTIECGRDAELTHWKNAHKQPSADSQFPFRLETSVSTTSNVPLAFESYLLHEPGFVIDLKAIRKRGIQSLLLGAPLNGQAGFV